MPQQSAQTARETVNDAKQESLASWPDWTKTREEIIDEISKQGLSTDPQDLATLLTNTMRTSDYTAKLKEHLEEELKFSQESEDVMFRLFTPLEAERARLEKALEDSNPEATRAKNELRQVLLKRPLTVLHLDKDAKFVKDFHKASRQELDDMSKQVQALHDTILCQRPVILEELREILGVDEVKRRYDLFCLLANTQAVKAHKAVRSVQRQAERLKAEVSTLRQTLDDERTKTTERDTRAKDLLADKIERLGDLKEINELRKGEIKTLRERASANDGLLAEKDAAVNRMKASLDAMNSKIQGLELNARTVEAAQEKAQASATAAIDARDTRIRDLDVAAVEYEAAQSEFQATIARQAEELQSAAATINARDTRIRDLEVAAAEYKVVQGQFQATIARQAEELQSAAATIDERDTRIRDLDVAADERDRKVESLEAKLSASELADGDKDETIANLERFAQDTIKDKDEEVADLKTNHDRVLAGTREQLKTVRADLSRLTASIQAMESNINQFDVPQTLSGEGEILGTELTRTSFGKRPHRPSSTSTNPSPRKEPSKRARRSAFRQMQDHLLGSGSSSRQSIDRSSPSRQTSFLQPTRIIAPELRTNRLDSGLAQRSTLPEFSLSLQNPIGLGSPRQSTVGQSENEEEEEVAGPSNAPLSIPDNLVGIWNQLKLDETHGRIDEAELLGLMKKSQARSKSTSRPAHLLKDCAEKTASGVHMCFTSKLRSKGGGDFEERGFDHPCKGCQGKFACLRVKWFNHQALKDENAVKRWVLEPR
ncbi:MAG: hypothetical protein Q9193_000348 [Seirophora villosa]